MLDRFYLNPVLPAQDGDRARAFFRDVLGLKLLSGPTDDPTEMPERTPAGYAVISFMVTGIEEIVAELKARGVSFEKPGSSSFQGQRAVAGEEIADYGPVKSAWFKESEGNILALNEILS
ncbi:MAG: hypothetical protein H0U09_12530 [Geodermatophilaceae bacterium]|nr:hypothetical protein [Geodermatophilaceae bacterium]